MVAKIPKPSDDCVAILKLVLSERVKFKKFYSCIRVDLIARFHQYDTQKGCPYGMPPLVLRRYVDTDKEAIARKTTLLGLYSPTADKYPFNELKKLRKKNRLLACPVCGEVGRPRTLDHCLPKTVYPEFAVHLLNLVPACDWCQGEKLTDYKNAAGTRSFLHPYYDDLNQPLYKIILDPPYLTPIISFEVRTELPAELRAIVASHLEGVGFWDRFKEYFEESYQNIILLASQTRAEGKITVEQALTSSYSLQVMKGLNSWDAVVYRSLLEDPDAMHFLQNGKLPAFP